MKKKLKKIDDSLEMFYIEEDQDADYLSIDLLQLDREWVLQPNLARKWNRKLANAQDDLQIAEDYLEYHAAELEKAIREDPADFGFVKATDKSVAAAILLQDSYQKQIAKVNRCKHKVGLLKANTIGIENKKKALEKLADLWMADYHAEPREPKGHKKDLDDLTTERIIRKRNRK